MTAQTINMSGLITLSTEHAAVLEALGLTTPHTVTTGRLQALLKEADAIVAGMNNEFIARMARSSLADLRTCLNLQ